MRQTKKITGSIQSLYVDHVQDSPLAQQRTEWTGDLYWTPRQLAAALKHAEMIEIDVNEHGYETYRVVQYPHYLRQAQVEKAAAAYRNYLTEKNKQERLNHPVTKIALAIREYLLGY